ncbi:replication protein A 70 kDa DNA-binding subunit [Dendroctonus ponderosae]|nr:replication protein A 70 kDa DNA-binding subunit [Dendroctonus ponderosae]KAH1018979.1 hypothetical protein HUJ05_006649 [Dendroctonus ponderosae]
MSIELSKGALATIMQGGDYIEPIVQVLSIKRMNSGTGQPDKDKFRALLSDGQCTVSFAMMTAPVYARAGENGLAKFSIIKIVRFITSVINNTEGKDSRVLLILDLTVLKDGNELGEKIGNPVSYSQLNVGPSTNYHQSSANAIQAAGSPSKKPRLSVPFNANCGTSSSRAVYAISSLSPFHNKWIIRAKVINKSDIRKWENSKGVGQLFSFEIADESSEIKCTAFKELVDQFYDVVQVDKIYYISKCQIKIASKQFNTVKNDYEIYLTPDTVIEECFMCDLPQIPTNFNFVEIRRIADLHANELIDVIGVAKSTSDLQIFTAKSSGREIKKRDVQLVDQSKTVVTLTLWGGQAENFNGNGNPVISLKNAKIHEFLGGKSLSTISSTQMRINPETKEAFLLKAWYESEGARITNAYNISVQTGGGNSAFNPPWMCFKEVSGQQLGRNSDKADSYQVKGTILLIKGERLVYKSCPGPDCQKKVIDNSNGTYTCQSCNKSFNSFKFRILCNMNVCDWSSNQWMTVFNDEAEKILGLTALEVGQQAETDPDGLNDTLEKCMFKECILRCRVKTETYNDEQRVKTVAFRADPINHSEYNAHLVNNIKKLARLS